MEIFDIRGARLPASGPPVLADPSGRRSRMLAHSGRVVAVVFLVWLLGLSLAGFGVLPGSDVPLGAGLASPAPAPLSAMPTPRQPSASDLTPARSRQFAAPASGRGAGAVDGHGLAGRRSVTSQKTRSRRVGAGPGSARRHRPVGTQGPQTAAPPRAVTAPGATVRAGAPGHSKTTAPGKSGSAPARQKTTAVTTSPGKSGSAPGHITTSSTATTPGGSGLALGRTVPPGNGRGSGA